MRNETLTHESSEQPRALVLLQGVCAARHPPTPALVRRAPAEWLVGESFTALDGAPLANLNHRVADRPLGASSATSDSGGRPLL